MPLMHLFLQTPLGRKEENLQWEFRWASKTNWQDKVAKTKAVTGRHSWLSLELPTSTIRAGPPSPGPPRSIEALWLPIDGLCSAHPSIATCLPSSSPLLPPFYLINAAHSSWLFPYRSTIPCKGKGVNAVKGRHLLGDFSLLCFLRESFVPTR